MMKKYLFFEKNFTTQKNTKEKTIGMGYGIFFLVRKILSYDEIRKS
jgi:hypothetical protein